VQGSTPTGNQSSIKTMGDIGAAGGGGGTSGGFGPDTIIFQANAAGALVRTLELVNTLTISAPGAEESTWDINLLHGGAEVTAQHIGGLGTIFPAGFFDGNTANTICSVGLFEAGTGLRFIDIGGGIHAIAFDAQGTEAGYFDANSLLGFGGGRMRILGTTPSLVLGDRWTVGNTFAGNVDWQVLQTGGQTGDMILGKPIARTGIEAIGYVQAPAYAAAGKPAGVPTINLGHFALTFNTTTKKLEVYDAINAVWSETAALT
jgi:hypothetical protein